jgi:class 3 adenylate cyclase
MLSHGVPGEIQVSATTYAQLRTMDCFAFEARGAIAVKGKGSIETYMLRRGSDSR